MSTMTASVTSITPTTAVALPAGENTRLGVSLALMTLFLVVAFVGSVTGTSGVVIGAGFMTAVLSVSLVFGTIKDAIESTEA